MQAAPKPPTPGHPTRRIPPAVLPQMMMTSFAAAATTTPLHPTLAPAVPWQTAHAAARLAGHGVAVLEAAWPRRVAAAAAAGDGAVGCRVEGWEGEAFAAVWGGDGALRGEVGCL
jgi:hypothetical protein